MRAGDVDLVPVHAKDESAGASMRGEEGIADPVGVAVGSAATRYRAHGVGTGRAEGNHTVGVHGTLEVAEVAGTGRGERGEGEDRSKAEWVTTYSNREGTPRA